LVQTNVDVDVDTDTTVRQPSLRDVDDRSSQRQFVAGKHEIMKLHRPDPPEHPRRP
jgi:hypothetical protein